MSISERASVGSALEALIATALARQGGWLPFDRFMALALYAPGLGYYSRGTRIFGSLPGSGSDFVTAPEMSPLFGRTLAGQLEQALQASGTATLWEFGAGSGALAATLLDALGDKVQRYVIVDLSGALRERQQELLATHAPRVEWVDHLPDTIEGVVIGNEVLDAMPVQLLHFDGQRWFERGVVRQGSGFAFDDRPTALRPPHDAPFVPGTTTEIHAQAEAFIATLAERLQRGAAFFIDYGFPAAEYFLPQRHGGTLMCHRGHRADADPLADVGDKDITAHVDFTGVALAGQEAGLEVIGYTSQARFLLNCGIAELMTQADLRERIQAQPLIAEHEMGELFKVIGFAKDCDEAFTTAPIGFAAGDRSHTL